MIASLYSFRTTRILAVIFSVAISACSTQPKPEPALSAPTEPGAAERHSAKPAKSQTETTTTAANEKHQDHGHTDPEHFTQWQVQGKLGIRLPDNSGSLYFNWKQEPNSYAIHLSGPLGQGATWIRGNHSGVTIQAGSQPKVFAATPEALLIKTLGWDLPVQELYYWIRGVQSPLSDITSVQRSDEGRFMSLEQSGWQLQFLRYKDFSGRILPKKLIAQRNDIRLTFVIKNWNID